MNTENTMGIKSEISALVQQVLKIKRSMGKDEVLMLSLKQIVSILTENEENMKRKKEKEQDRKDLKSICSHLSTMYETDKYPKLVNNLKVFIQNQVPSCTD